MNALLLPGYPRILVIRTDNIGDLICTTPLIHIIRRCFPAAWIGVLTSAYSAPVLEGNPDINQVFAYTKTKHRPGSLLFALYWQRLKLIFQLRRIGLDLTIVAAPDNSQAARRFAYWSAAKRMIGMNDLVHGTHEVERVFSKLHSNLKLSTFPETIPACRVFVDEQQKSALLHSLPDDCQGKRLVGLHISARRPDQRMSVAQLVELAHVLHCHAGVAFLLFWSPGSADHPQHPGDDEKATQILEQCADLPMHGMPTTQLRSLIDAIGCCDRFICSDGGAMHIAAGLGVPIICFFGNSDSARWHPWKAPHRLLQPESRHVEDIRSADVIAAWDELNDQEIDERSKVKKFPSNA